MMWGDVLAAFAHVEDPQAIVDRKCLAQGVESPDLSRPHPVRVERWSHVRIGQLLYANAERVPDMISDKEPRRSDTPIVVYEGVILDGIRRCNRWCRRKGLYRVLVVSRSSPHRQ